MSDPRLNNTPQQLMIVKLQGELAEANATIDALKAKLAEAEKIISKMPRDADGSPSCIAAPVEQPPFKLEDAPDADLDAQAGE